MVKMKGGGLEIMTQGAANRGGLKGRQVTWSSDQVSCGFWAGGQELGLGHNKDKGRDN